MGSPSKITSLPAVAHDIIRDWSATHLPGTEDVIPLELNDGSILSALNASPGDIPVKAWREQLAAKLIDEKKGIYARQADSLIGELLESVRQNITPGVRSR